MKFGTNSNSNSFEICLNNSNSNSNSLRVSLTIAIAIAIEILRGNSNRSFNSNRDNFKGSACDEMRIYFDLANPVVMKTDFNNHQKLSV